MDANKILKRVSEVDKLRAAGLTDDEIQELKGWQLEKENQAEERVAEIENVIEFSRLKRLEEAGLIDEDDQKKLDRQTGVFFTFNFRGEVIRVNHCIVMRTIIGGAILFSALTVIYLTTFSPLKIARPDELNQ